MYPILEYTLNDLQPQRHPHNHLCKRHTIIWGANGFCYVGARPNGILFTCLITRVCFYMINYMFNIRVGGAC